MLGESFDIESGAPVEQFHLPPRGDATNAARQLRAVQKLFGYQYGRNPTETETLTLAVAEMLAENGIGDIRDFGFATRTVLVASQESGDTYGDMPVWINKTTGARILECGQFPVSPDTPQDGTYTACYPLTDWKLFRLPNRYWVRFTAKVTEGGIPYFIPEFGRSSSLSEDLRMIAGFLLMAIPGVGATLAPAIFGSSFVAAYPAIASIATNVAVSTVLSGGDVEAAVKGALASFAGGAFGGQVGATLNSDLAAKLTSVATTAALQGGDVESAVQNALLRYGAGSAGDFFGDVIETATAQPVSPTFDIPLDEPEGQSMDTFDNWGGDFYGGATFADPVDQFAQLDLSIDNLDFGSIESPIAAIDFADADFDYGTPAPYLDPSAGGEHQIDAIDFADADFDYGTPAPSPQQIAAIDFADADFEYGTPNPSPVPGYTPSASDGYTFSQGIKDVTSLAMAAIQVSAAYQQTQRPAPIAAGSRTSTAGNTVTAQADGNVTVRSPSGQVSVQRPPAGVPYGTADGGVIVNNGDGTYTYASANGATQTRPYASASAGKSGDMTKTLAIGGAVLAAVFLLGR